MKLNSIRPVVELSCIVSMFAMVRAGSHTTEDPNVLNILEHKTWETEVAGLETNRKHGTRHEIKAKMGLLGFGRMFEGKTPLSS